MSLVNQMKKICLKQFFVTMPFHHAIAWSELVVLLVDTERTGLSVLATLPPSVLRGSGLGDSDLGNSGTAEVFPLASSMVGEVCTALCTLRLAIELCLSTEFCCSIELRLLTRLRALASEAALEIGQSGFPAPYVLGELGDTGNEGGKATICGGKEALRKLS